jgi:hypothetical protein
MSDGAGKNATLWWVAGVAIAGLMWRAVNKKKRAVIPRQDQVMALFRSAAKMEALATKQAAEPNIKPNIKVHFMNLVKFRDRAVYEDGRPTDLSGEAAFKLYDDLHREIIRQCGGSIIFSGDASCLVIGPGNDPEFDRVLIFELPSFEAYNDVAGGCVEEQAKSAFQDHQFAAIAFQQLILLKASPS